MGFFRFRRSFGIMPGVRVNLSKSGVSTSIGRRGAWFTFGPRGTRSTIGISGTGLSYTEQSRGSANVPKWFVWAAIIAAVFVGGWLRWTPTTPI